MNLKRIAAIVLAATLMISQESAYHLNVQAEEVSLGSETAENKEEDAAFYSQGKEAFSQLIADHQVYALLYNCASADIMGTPSYDAAPVVNLRVGHQVNLTGVEYADGQTWYQVETMVNGNTYIGYLADAMLVSADEGLTEWRGEWLSEPETSMFAAQASGAGNTDLSLFPESYRSYIQALIEAHPNWTFVPLDTGLDWNTVIKNEVSPARNLVPLATMDTWKVSNDVLSEPYWVQASESIVRYYMDPRNFLNEDSVFQFELLSYNSDNHKLSGVKSILKNTFMSDAIVEGTEMTYAEAFMQIGKELKISPYHLASRVRQEQGEGTSPLISGTYPGYEGLYNYYNIQAAGATHDEIIVNGLIEAQQAGWTSRYAALYGGSEKIGKNYISVGQNTLYLQKFDVDNSDGTLYWHQYMQNLLAAANEGKSVKKGYEEMGVLDNAFVFCVPVYQNMPETAIKMPTDTLETPTLKSSIKQFSEVTLNWSEVAGAQGYEIYRSTKKDSGYKKIKTLTSVGVLSWKETISTNKTYYYKVRGYKTFQGVTAYSAYSPVKKVSSVIPKPEWEEVKTASYSKISLKWTKANNVTGYEIYRKTGSKGSYEKITTIVNSNTLSYTDTTVSPKNTYYYKVRSYKGLNGKKHYSSFNTEQKVEIKMETPALSNIVLSEGTDLKLTWKSKKWVNGYQIYRAESADGKYQLVQEIKGQKVTTYTDETIKANKTYYYKIRSYVTINGSKKYSSFSKAMMGEIKLTKPTFKTSYTAETTKITLKWNKNRAATGYEIQQKSGGKWKTVATIKKNSASKVITSLQAGTTYQFRIRAYKTVDDEKYYSAYASLKATTAPEQATITNAKSSAKKQLKVTWKQVANATGYQLQISLNKNFKEAAKYNTTTYEIAKGTTRAKTVKKLTSGKKYHVRLRAYRTVGKQTIYGSWSARKSVTIK